MKNLPDLRAIPLARRTASEPTRLDAVTSIKRIHAPTEVDHYQLRRVIDVYVGLHAKIWAASRTAIDGIVARRQLPKGVRVDAARHGAGHARFVPELRARA